MAGSLKWVQYTDDFGTIYALQVDESNWEAVNGTAWDYTGTPPLVDALPRNVRARAATYVNATGTRSIRIPVATQLLYSSLTADTPTITDPIAGTGTLTLARITPERRRLPIAADTGLDDGDST